MSIYSVYVINKHGSLLYSADFTQRQNKTNDKIRWASMFHAISAMAGQLSPVSSKRPVCLQGIECVSFSNFMLHCKQTLTGMKFLLVTKSPFNNAEEVLKQIYRAYADYVMQNPFYIADMPIKFIGFTKMVKQIIILHS